MSNIRIVAVHRNKSILEYLQEVFSVDVSVKVVGIGSDGQSAIDLAEELHPDILMLDAQMVEGGETIFDIGQKSSTTRILLMMDYLDQCLIFLSLRLGARGYILHSGKDKHLLQAVKKVMEGELWVERSVLTGFIDPFIRAYKGTWTKPAGLPRERLTPREQEILRLIKGGLSNKCIASLLFISEKTVKCHLSNIFKKLNVRNRFEIILYASEGYRLLHEMSV